MTKTIMYMAFCLGLFVSCKQPDSWFKQKTETASENYKEQEMIALENTKLFLSHINLLSNKESVFTQLAAEKASKPKVKKFTDGLVEQRLGVCAALQLFTKQLPVTIPVTAATVSLPVTLQKPALKNFDKVFMDSIIDTHKKTIALLVDATNDNILPDAKIVINQALPQLQSHLEMAESVRHELL